jgi:hypothetical protein
VQDIVNGRRIEIRRRGCAALVYESKARREGLDGARHAVAAFTA